MTAVKKKKKDPITLVWSAVFGLVNLRAFKVRVGHIELFALHFITHDLFYCSLYRRREQNKTLKDICLEAGHCFIGRLQQHSPSASAEVRFGEQPFSKLFLKLNLKDVNEEREKERHTHIHTKACGRPNWHISTFQLLLDIHCNVFPLRVNLYTHWSC